MWAVGGTYGATLIDHWNGSAWSTVPRPGDYGTLNSVAAVAANDVWAVGQYFSSGSTLTEHWDGSDWSIVPSPSPGAWNHLYGVSARASNDVWAVGDTERTGGGTMTLAEHWDGSAWTQVQMPASPTWLDHLYGVAVTGGGLGVVWAVGAVGCMSGCSQNALIARHSPICPTPTATGTPPTNTATRTRTATRTPTRTSTPTPEPCALAWRIVPSLSGVYEVRSVAAVSANDMWAVGTYFPYDYAWTLIEHWDGTQWSLVPSPNAGQVNRLEGLVVVSANDIWAVGEYAHLWYLPLQTLIEHWDGTSWSVVSSPNTTTTNNNELYGVAAVSVNDIWAVGGYNPDQSTGWETLIEHWNGSTWSIVPSPGLDALLYGVAAVAANDVWAVGGSLILHWNGTSWSIVPNPGPGRLYGVAAVAANDVWAVGNYYESTSYRTVILHWNGTSWSSVPSPNQDTRENILRGVAAVAANDVWAVGDSYRLTLTEHWDGTQWSIVPSPGISELYGVAAVASNDVWAVGNWNNSTLIEHYNAQCGAATLTPTNTPTRTRTPATRTRTPVATATPCTISFSDVYPTDYFYQAVRYLYCMGAISGYADGTFRPYNNTTRAQLSKIVVLASGWPIDTTGGPHFSDVPPDHNFYDYIETAYNRDIISGYSDGTFRPDTNIKRAQLSKIIVLAQQWPIDTTGGPHFSDVSASHPFYGYIETAYNHGIITGYGDGTFRPDNSATRGQICKIVHSAIVQP